MRKILLVEDDKMISAIFGMFLKELGHELVGQCSTGIDAVQMCHSLKPDIVLMDIHLEGEVDGIQTAEKLRRELEIPVVFISSDTSRETIKRAIVSNTYGFLVKPINKRELGIGIDLAFYKHRVDMEHKERERGYREFISEAPMPIVVVSEDKIFYLNKWALDVFKTHYMEDVMLLPFSHYIDAKSKVRVEAIMKEFLMTGQGFENIKINMTDIHGQSVWVKMSGSCIMFNGKKCLQLTLSETNQVNYKKALEELKEMFEFTNTAYFVVDGENQVIDQCEHSLFKGVALMGTNISSHPKVKITSSGGEISLMLQIPGGGSKQFRGKLFRNELDDIAAIIYYAMSPMS